jgi:copper chaperone
MPETTLTVDIGGMSCGHCQKAVRNALETLDGVQIDEVAIGRASVRFDSAQLQSATIAEAIRDAGYTIVATH